MDQTKRNQGDDRLEATATDGDEPQSLTPNGVTEIESAFEDGVASSEAFQNLREQVQDLDGVVIESLERLEQLEATADHAEALSKKVEHLEKRVARLDAKRTNANVQTPDGEAITGPLAPDANRPTGGPK